MRDLEPALANFATPAARTLINSFSAAGSSFGIIETAVFAVAVFAVVDNVACVLPNESSKIGVSIVDALQAVRFGSVFRDCGSALRRCKIAKVLQETVVTTDVDEACALGPAVKGVTVSTIDYVVDSITKGIDGQ